MNNYADLPPAIFIHGTVDDVTPYANIKHHFDHLQSNGVPSTLITLQGCSHDNIIPFWNDLLTTDPYKDIYFDDMTTNLY